MTFSDDQISGFRDLTEKASSIVFIPHQNPDGDAIGSILGWWNVFKNRGIKINVVVPDKVPSNLRWMTGSEDIIVYDESREKAEQIIKGADLFFFLDFNAINRCGDMAEIIKPLTTPRILIDHHPDASPDIAAVMFSDISVSSTCELSYHLLTSLGWQHDLDVPAAECLYAGIITDTGLLSYNSSNPRTYSAVAGLVERGISKNKIHKALFQSNSFRRMKLLGHVLCNKLELMSESQAAFISISKDELEQYDYEPGDTEGFVNYPLGIENVEISGLFTEREKDKFVKISFRSSDNIPINIYSEQYFSGGGHKNAAGGEWHGALGEAIDRFKATLPGFLTKILEE
jgi:phosphoesterase RecJ-like protein